MSVVKVVELIGESNQSWEEAARSCVEEASKTIENIKSVYVKDMQLLLDGGKSPRYRVDCKLSFVVDDHRRQAAP